MAADLTERVSDLQKQVLIKHTVAILEELHTFVKEQSPDEKCDCLNYCGDDSRLEEGKVQPCSTKRESLLQKALDLKNRDITYKEGEIADLYRCIHDVRELTKELYANRGEDKEVSRVCNAILDRLL